MSGRRSTTPSMVIALALAIFVGAAGTAIANDGRLDLALANLEKASLLLLAADEQPQLDEKTEKEYSRHLVKAIDAIIEADGHISDAIAVADAP